jgi:hypothetical protein
VTTIRTRRLESLLMASSKRLITAKSALSIQYRACNAQIVDHSRIPDARKHSLAAEGRIEIKCFKRRTTVDNGQKSTDLASVDKAFQMTDSATRKPQLTILIVYSAAQLI